MIFADLFADLFAFVLSDLVYDLVFSDPVDRTFTDDWPTDLEGFALEVSFGVLALPIAETATTSLPRSSARGAARGRPVVAWRGGFVEIDWVTVDFFVVYFSCVPVVDCVVDLDWVALGGHLLGGMSGRGRAWWIRYRPAWRNSSSDNLRGRNL